MNSRVALGLIVTGGAAYAVLSHQLMTHATHSPWALAAMLGPVAAFLLISVRRSGHRALALLLAVGVVALIALSANGRALPAEWLYLAQHAGWNAGLGLWFGSTLFGGATPLISQVARRVHRGLAPGMAAYTRQVTWVWTLYFVAMTAVSLLLFVAAPFSAWSLFANVMTPALLAVLFVGEPIVRYRLHPEFERVGLMATVRAYSQPGDTHEPPSPSGA